MQNIIISFFPSNQPSTLYSFVTIFNFPNKIKNKKQKNIQIYFFEQIIYKNKLYKIYKYIKLKIIKKSTLDVDLNSWMSFA